ncbi:MAG: peroxiredoxin family protein, partial [Chloroflexota bacterium]
HEAQFQALGIDKIVSITTQPLDVIKQKAQLEGIRTPVLSDASLAVSQAYQANRYGMMGTSMDGHSFVLVGKDGIIKWRADYGGPPKYIMYVPVANLVADIRAGLKGASA